MSSFPLPESVQLAGEMQEVHFTRKKGFGWDLQEHRMNILHMHVKKQN